MSFDPLARCNEPKIINLCDYGINLWEMLKTGAGVFSSRFGSPEIFGAIPDIGKELIVVNDDGVNYAITLNNVVTAHLNGRPVQVAFSFSALTDDGPMVSSSVAIIPYSFSAEEVVTVVTWKTELYSLS